MTDSPTIPEDSDVPAGFEDVDPLDIAEVLLQRFGDAIGDPTAQGSPVEPDAFVQACTPGALRGASWAPAGGGI